jgi:hypothetical protein
MYTHLENVIVIDFLHGGVVDVVSFLHLSVINLSTEEIRYNCKAAFQKVKRHASTNTTTNKRCDHHKQGSNCISFKNNIK